MVFHNEPNLNYVKNGYWVDESGDFAIGIIEELFNRYKIQFLVKSGVPVSWEWDVVMEWVSYDKDLIAIQVAKIMVVTQHIQALSFRDWPLLVPSLSTVASKHKYLEGHAPAAKTKYANKRRNSGGSPGSKRPRARAKKTGSGDTD